jgi:predicted amidophosphoribosyltransferase
MVRFYCPGCWKDFGKDYARCPFCGLNIHEFWDSKDHVEKLILALNHPEPSTPIRAAWLLGKTKDPRAVDALIDLFRRTDDLYIAKSAVDALGELDTAEAIQFLGTITTHPASVIRREVKRILALKVRSYASNKSHGKETL